MTVCTKNIAPAVVHVLTSLLIALSMSQCTSPDTPGLPIRKGDHIVLFTTTMGASVDLESEDLRRLLINACYWAVEMEDQIPEKDDANIVGEYRPTMFGFGEHQTGM